MDAKNPEQAICPLPWVGLSFNVDSSLRVCCNTDHGGFVKNGSQKIFLADIADPLEVSQAETKRKLKTDMLNGVRSDFCRTCYRVEDSGGMSIRQYYVRKYEKQIKEIIKEKNLEKDYPIKFLDFALSNNCNLKCRMCSPASSYNLVKDFQDLNIPYEQEFTERAHKAWRYDGLIRRVVEGDGVQISDMLFTGGEPLTNQVHLNVLQSLYESGKSSQICLSYHSNLMVIPDQVLQMWKKFKKVELHLSLEGHNQYNDYIRYKSDFSKILENLNMLIASKKQLNLWIEIHTVFQAYNFMIIPEFLEYLKVFQKDIPCFPHFIWIDQPDFLSANSLPKELKIKGTQKILEYLEENARFYRKAYCPEFIAEKIDILKSYLTRLNDEDNTTNLNRFREYTKKFDQLRGQNAAEVFPELKGLF